MPEAISNNMGILPCLLPPASDDEYEINDENDPGKIGFKTRCDLKNDDNLPIPVPPPPRSEVLFTAQPYNHGSCMMTPPHRQLDDTRKNATPKKNPNYCPESPLCTNSVKKKTQFGQGAEATRVMSRTPTKAQHRKTSSDVNGEASPNLIRNRDGYDSDNLNTRARVAFARRQDRTVKNSLLKKIGPAFDNLRTEGSIMEKLFGDVVKPVEDSSQHSSIPSTQYTQDVITRKLVSSSLYQSDSTNLWIVTVDTNNGGWKAETSTLQAFTFSTLEEAREAAYSYAPPLLAPFDESPTCFGCNGKFAVFRRAVHCKNCGVCVCRKCAVQWSASRLPQTYNHKREPKLKVCLSCNFLSDKFQKALLQGEEEEAFRLYETGNLNIRCPFGKDDTGEILFPVHCAVRGGNLNLVRWLIDVHFCPIFMTQLTNSYESKEGNSGGASTQPLVTSKGRSALFYAMSTQNIDVLRYLAIEKGMSLFETKDLQTTLLNLKIALERLPRQLDQENRLLTACTTNYDNIFISESHGKDQEVIAGAQSFESESATPAVKGEQDDDDNVTTTTVNDACIICFVNVIDCVLLPCGHQICCIHCSKTLNLCPICNIKCTYRKIFKP